MEWIQSFQGILVLTVGGVSVTSIIVAVTTLFKNLSGAKSFKEALEFLKTSKTENENLWKAIKAKDFQISLGEKTIEKLNLELEHKQEVENYILKGLSIIIAASGGIDPITKIELLGDLKELQKEATVLVTESVQGVIEKTKEEVKKEVLVQGKDLLDKTVKAAQDLINKHSQ
jgi:predicted PP-loop superfamily ATPase